jgi:tetratricopeptide (TPR) repeat protein
MRRVIVAFFCTMLAVATVRAQDAADLARSIELYTKADYKTAIAVLQAMDESKLRRDERVTRHKFLALSLIGRKERGRAQEEFIKLLEIEPDYELSNKEVSPSVLELFKQSKIEHGNRVCDRAVDAYNAGRFREAVPDFESALRLNPNDTRAREFLRLAENRVKEADQQDYEEIEKNKKKREECLPIRAWGELDARSANCGGADYSSKLPLPARANRITLIYAKHHYGVGKCWKIALLDSEGREIFTFKNEAFAVNRPLDSSSRLTVIDLPKEQTIARVVMSAEGGREIERRTGQLVGKDLEDEFILLFEVACPPVEVDH